MATDTQPGTAYMTDGERLLEVLAVEADGTVLAHDCADEDDTSYLTLPKNSLVGWRIVHTEGVNA